MDEGAGFRRRIEELLAPESDIGIIGETADGQEAVEVGGLASGGLGLGVSGETELAREMKSDEMGILRGHQSLG